MALERVIRKTQNIKEMDMIGNNTLLAYADDIVILEESKAELTTSILKLLENSRKMGFRINENKTKYTIVSRKPTIMHSLKVGQYLFEQVEHFKYLGVNINRRNNMHNEVKLRLGSANRGYHTMRSVFSSRLLSRETKTKLYIAYLRPIVMYACETWSTTKGNELKLLIF